MVFLGNGYIINGHLEYVAALREETFVLLRESVVKAPPEQLIPAAPDERHAWRMARRRRTKLFNFDEFSGNRWKDITNDERPPLEEDGLAQEDVVLDPSSGLQEIHLTGGRRVTAKTTFLAILARWINKFPCC